MALPGLDFGPDFFSYVLGQAKEPISAFTRVALPTPSGVSGVALPGAAPAGPALPGMIGGGPGVALPGQNPNDIARMFPTVGDILARGQGQVKAQNDARQKASAPQAPQGAQLGGGTGYAKNVAENIDTINRVSQETGVPARVLAAIIDIENGGLDPRIVRADTGAAGLMQVVGGPVDPLENIRAGARLLRTKQAAWGIAPDDWENTAAAYFGAYHNNQVTDARDATGTSGTQYVQKFRDAYGRYPDEIRAPAPAVNEGYTFPVQGYQGQVQLHHGSDQGATDLMAPGGSPVVAMRGGKVISAGYDNTGGNYVLIQGNDGLQYYYAHLQAAPLVQAGAYVPTGQPLGAVGDTGNAKGTGTHLHIGIGKTIASGVGPHGGAGEDYNAVELLRSIYGR